MGQTVLSQRILLLLDRKVKKKKKKKKKKSVATSTEYAGKLAPNRSRPTLDNKVDRLDRPRPSRSRSLLHPALGCPQQGPRPNRSTELDSVVVSVACRSRPSWTHDSMENGRDHDRMRKQQSFDFLIQTVGSLLFLAV